MGLFACKSSCSVVMQAPFIMLGGILADKFGSKRTIWAGFFLAANFTLIFIVKIITKPDKNHQKLSKIFQNLSAKIYTKGGK